jgi:hypothetical protein
MEGETSGREQSVTAVFGDGPLAGTAMHVAPVEGRPPKTIDVPAEDGEAMYRYCLAEWTQKGLTASYEFLYQV